ncbi:helicase-exonuclease AddAB subunit AddB [Bacillus sp. HMF5848]|uniref:helicase-exonuclease AddAB subunit AddB n=1 Tax=Bacillus sp. HMF5848 TaxID=2495421 RepID=UPI000F77CE9B|nr:helicase-exonuclease AddAB subunit AddB [Bacillus sp. HMF5848]RSK26355.1 helicase-exonuclease AddAB subunit AddB [Bacillus sp. HMF5848]
MAIQFLIGKSGSGKTKYILDEIRRKTLENPKGPPIILLVPDQMTFQLEYALIRTPGLHAMMRPQVLSITRLAWRILQETGGMSRYHLSNIGINMLLRKIVLNHKQQLKVYNRASEKGGFIKQLEEMIAEFKRYQLSPEDLASYSEDFLRSQDGQAADKLHDLQLIYKQLEYALLNKYVDTEDYVRLLNEHIPLSDYLKEATIYVDGFHDVAAQELAVLINLMKVSQSFKMALTLDKPVSVYEETDLFATTQKTYLKLKKLADQEGLSFEDPLVFNDTHRFEESPSLRHLETQFMSRPAQPFKGQTDITIAQAANRRAEIEGIAREIHDLVRDKQYRYTDIAVLVRNANNYEDVLKPVFESYDIPYFIDQKRSMLHHPLIEFIRSSLDIVSSHWRYESIFRCVKTELLFPLNQSTTMWREKMDILENYVLSYGIQGANWYKGERWTYEKYRGLDSVHYAKTDQDKELEDTLHECRQLIVPSLKQLQDRLKRAKSGRAICEAVFLYIEQCDVASKLEQLRVQAELRGDLSTAREHAQVWKAVLELLDQYVEILGDEPIQLKSFIEILETGMDSLKFALVPPAIDQVLIADMERSRLTDISCTFIVGANEGVIPAKANETGLLSDDDRELFSNIGMELGPTSREQLFREDFLIYQALVSPAKRLYVSYPLANEEGKALLPSPIIKRLEEMFPNIMHDYYEVDPSTSSIEDQWKYITSPLAVLPYATSQLQQFKRGYPVEDVWWQVYNYLIEHDLYSYKAKKVFSSLFYSNTPTMLKKETSKELYGDEITASVSRMEAFYRCPFSHFSSHGLKLEQRQMYKLDAPDIGQFFHAALTWMTEELKRRGLDWKHVTQEQCLELALQAANVFAPRLQKEILLSSSRLQYVKRKLEQVISRTALILREHAKVSGFSPVGLELAFGPNGQLPPLTFELENGARMQVVGRIDRVDKADSDNGVYLRVVDYKSSAKKIDLNDVMYGLTLQMLTYLDVVVTHASDWIGTDASPAGVLYFHVHNPFIKAKSASEIDTLEEDILQQFRMKGLLLGDENVARLMDTSLSEGVKSKIVQLGLTKKGGFSQRDSKIASNQELNELRQYARKLFIQAGNDIVSGDVSLAPFKMKNRTPCTYCSYKTVCQFDESFHDNQYRQLKTEKRDDIMMKIRKEVQDFNE